MNPAELQTYNSGRQARPAGLLKQSCNVTDQAKRSFSLARLPGGDTVKMPDNYIDLRTLPMRGIYDQQIREIIMRLGGQEFGTGDVRRIIEAMPEYSNLAKKSALHSNIQHAVRKMLQSGQLELLSGDKKNCKVYRLTPEAYWHD